MSRTFSEETAMSPGIEALEARLRSRICRSCPRWTRFDTCSLPRERQCAIFSNLEKLVEIVGRVQSCRIEPYLEAVREQICSTCRFEDVNGECRMRQAVDCALDGYLSLIVEEAEASLAGAPAKPRA
jgi:hypothetical protein